MWLRLGLTLLCATGLIMSCTGGDKPVKRVRPVPAEYKDKHMPEGWWIDPTIIKEGERIYRGEVHTGVNCAKCHGKDGEPSRRGARDFRASKRISLFSEGYWFWRIREGVPRTKMRAFKEKLSEEDIWKVIAFEHTFSHGGQPALHDDYQAPPNKLAEQD